MKTPYSVIMTLLAGFALGAQTASPPEFSPNAGVGWISLRGQFRPPRRGPGPVVNDPAHPNVNGNDLPATGRQPTFPDADLNNPILHSWATEQLRKDTEPIASR